ncbi:hypothetical protein EST38_g2054 [Candolleomyces aberdarensis]|uniref:J domain-containing protein n=1 Tax=Candolleomyces aberdarensis TaxID=2316362 RepID=A0A4Q2DX16_9AGAR|nr:hypothetical protein EST38_g2054 [Candolleomyces aberdarensis]
MDFEKLSLYEVLEVSEDATADDLKKAYRKKVLEHHPDKNLDDTDAANVRFSKVQEAYEAFSLYQQLSHGLDAKTLFTLFDGLFRCIAYDESNHGGRSMGTTPRFGGMCYRWNARDASYCDEHRNGPFIEDFYNHWTNFKTKKSFDWMEFCDVRAQDISDPRIRRAVNKHNNLTRQRYKKDYEEIVSDLARNLRNMDVRHQRYLLVPKAPQPNQANQNKNKKNKKNKKKKKRGWW